MTPKRLRTPTAVISGAGIAGLAAALRLSQIGWQTQIIERSPQRRSSGYLVNLLGYGYDAVERMGLLPRLADRDVGEFTSILTAADGRAKVTTTQELARAALGPRAISVFRGDLESVLYDAAAPVTTIRFGTTIESITQDEQQVHMRLSDGSHLTADLLIGADGLHSGVRRTAFGPEGDFRVDLQHVVAAFPLESAPAGVPDHATATFIGPGRTGAVMNLGPARSAAFFAFRADPEPTLARGVVEAVEAAFGDLGGAVPATLRHLRNHPESAYFDSVSQVHMDSWRRGRVVLLGDAAWCVTLFAGYGAALALTGADRLAEILDQHTDVPAALREWETALRPEIGKRQALATKGIAQFAPPTRLHAWASELTLRALHVPMLRRQVLRRIERANGHELGENTHPSPQKTMRYEDEFSTGGLRRVH